MIVYRELASLCNDLGFSARTLYSVSRKTSSHYRSSQVPKGNGEFRNLRVPDDLLKRIQRRINERLLPAEPVSRYATAYRPGSSVKRNARPHVGAPVVLKLDIRHFFDHAIYPLVKDRAFPADRYSESNRILLTMLCTDCGALPQGAPTSPTISNLILRDFDDTVGTWCSKRGIVFTRYCDDMTFSGEFESAEVISFAAKELKKLGFFLNRNKTVVVQRGQRHQVTGIVVNEKLSIPISYKRKIRQEIYYIGKYGLENHLAHIGMQVSPEQYKASLLGRVAYVLSIEPDNSEFLMYRARLAVL